VAREHDNLIFWEVESGKEIKSCPVQRVNSATCIFARRQDPRRGLSDWRVRLWQWQTAKEPREVRLPTKGDTFQMGMDSTFHGSFQRTASGSSPAPVLANPAGRVRSGHGREVHRLDCNPITSTVSPDK